jgi:hypothetical protein
MLSAMIIPVLSISEWTEPINQCVTASAIHMDTIPHTICCSFFVQHLTYIQHWFNSNVLTLHGLVNYKMINVDFKRPIIFLSLKFKQLTHKNGSPVSQNTQHQCDKLTEVNGVNGNNCCLLWLSYKTHWEG